MPLLFFFFKKKTSCKFGHPPVCQNYKSDTGCIFGRTCFFRPVEAEEKPSKKSTKDGAKGSVPLLKESTHLGCVSQDSLPRKSFLREEGKLGSNAPSISPRAPGHRIKFRERKCASRGIIPKVCGSCVEGSYPTPHIHEQKTTSNYI